MVAIAGDRLDHHRKKLSADSELIKQVSVISTTPFPKSSRTARFMSRIILRVELLWCIATLATLALPVHAHTGGTTGLATVIVSGQTVQYNLQLPVNAVPTQLAD